MQDIEKLFRWDKPRKTIKEWYRQDFLKMSMRPQFIYALQIVGGLCYASLVFKFWMTGNHEAMGMAMTVILWYAICQFQSHMITKYSNLLRETFDSWEHTLNLWGKTAMILNKTDQEKKRLQERIDNMLEP